MFDITKYYLTRLASWGTTSTRSFVGWMFSGVKYKHIMDGWWYMQ